MKSWTKDLCLSYASVTVEVEGEYEPLRAATREQPGEGGFTIKRVMLEGQRKVDPKTKQDYFPSMDIIELVSDQQLDYWSNEIFEAINEGREE